MKVVLLAYLHFCLAKASFMVNNIFTIVTDRIKKIEVLMKNW